VQSETKGPDVKSSRYGFGVSSVQSVTSRKKLYAQGLKFVGGSLWHPDKFGSHGLRINSENFRMQKHSPQALKRPVRSPDPAEASEPGDQSELLHQTLGLGLVMMALLPKLFASGMSLLLFLGKSLLIGCQ